MANAIGAARSSSATTAAPEAGSAADLQPKIAFTDLREWIAEAKKLGEVREVKGLSWQSDIGAATEVVMHEENAPCVIFEEIPGTLKGSKVLVNFFGGERQKMTLGFPKKARAERGLPRPLHGRPQPHSAALCQ
jgi:3-polyprenyl-4-hydroxybenzoate decarboxylase